MDDYIRPCSNFTCVGQQLTYKLGDLFRCWNGQNLVLDNNTWDLIAEMYQEYFIKLSEMSFKVF